MTRLFEQAIETARTLPPERQDEIARLVLMLAHEDEPAYPPGPQALPSFNPSMDRASRDTAPEDEVQALWARHVL